MLESAKLVRFTRKTFKHSAGLSPSAESGTKHVALTDVEEKVLAQERSERMKETAGIVNA
jgi:hypothetical protein